MDFIKENFTEIITIALIFSELLGSIPQIKANSIYQLIVIIFKRILNK